MATPSCKGDRAGQVLVAGHVVQGSVTEEGQTLGSNQRILLIFVERHWKER